MSRRPSIVSDFDAIRRNIGRPGATEDPVLALASRRQAVKKAEADLSNRVRQADKIASAAIKGGGLALENLAEKYSELLPVFGAEQILEIAAAYAEHTDLGNERWDIAQQILETRATTLAGVIAQIEVMHDCVTAGIDLENDAESYERILAALRDMAAGGGQ